MSLVMAYPASDRDRLGRSLYFDAMPFDAPDDGAQWGAQTATAAAASEQRRQAWAAEAAPPAALVGGTPATHEELAHTYLDNPAGVGYLRGVADAVGRRPMAGGAGDGLGYQGVGSDVILPHTSNAPTAPSVAPQGTRFEAGRGAFADRNLGLATRVARGTYKDRMGRTMRLYEAPMPEAQRDHGVKDHSSSLQRALGLFARRQRPKREVQQAVNGPARPNDPALYQSSTLRVHDQAHVGDLRGNGRHQQAFPERDWERDANIYNGLNPTARSNEDRVIRPADTQRQLEAPPPLVSHALVPARPAADGARRGPVRRTDASAVRHTERGTAPSGAGAAAPVSGLVVLSDAAPRTRARAHTRRGFGASSDANAVRAAPRTARRADVKAVAALPPADVGVGAATERADVAASRREDAHEIAIEASAGVAFARGERVDGAVRVADSRQQRAPDRPTDGARVPARASAADHVHLGEGDDRHAEEARARHEATQEYGSLGGRDAERRLAATDDVATAAEAARRAEGGALASVRAHDASVRLATHDAHRLEETPDADAAGAGHEAARVAPRVDAGTRDARHVAEADVRTEAPADALNVASLAAAPRLGDADDARVDRGDQGAAVHNAAPSGAQRLAPRVQFATSDRVARAAAVAPGPLDDRQGPRATPATQQLGDADARQVHDDRNHGVLAGGASHPLSALPSLGEERASVEYVASAAVATETRVDAPREVATRRTSYSHEAPSGAADTRARMESVHRIGEDAPELGEGERTVGSGTSQDAVARTIRPAVQLGSASGGTVDTDRLRGYNPTGRRAPSPGRSAWTRDPLNDATRRSDPPNTSA